MQLTDLPTAPTPNGVTLRREAYKALNSARILFDITHGESDAAPRLKEFFLGMAALCPKTPSKGKTS